MPEGTVDVIPVDLVVASIIDAAARPAPAEPTIVQVRIRVGEPVQVPTAGRPRAELLHRTPDLRPRGPAHRRTRVVVPRPRSGAATARTGPEAARAGRAGPAGAAPPRQAGRVGRHDRGDEGRRRSGPGLRRALRRLHGVRGHLRRRRLLGSLGLPRPPRTRRRSASTHAVIDWSHYATEHPPAVGGGARPRAHHARRAHRREARGPAAPAGARPRSATSRPSTSRTHSSPRTWWRPTRGWPPADCRPRTACASCSRCSARRRPCWPPTASDRSDFLRHFYRRYDGADVAQLEADAVEMFSDLILTKSFPAAHPPGARAPAARPPHGAHHRRARPRHRAAAPAVRRHRVPRRSPCRPDGTYRGELTDVPPTGEARAQALIDYADGHGFDLAESVAYADSTSRPADARSRRLPGGREPRDPPGRAGPQARVVGRALRQGARRPPTRCCRSARRGAAPRSRRVGRKVGPS